MRIEGLQSGTGSTNQAGVNSRNQFSVVSEAQSQQHYISLNEEELYSVMGDFATINAATHVLLIVTNDSSADNLYIYGVKVQMLDYAGGTALPNVATYFTTGVGQTYTSGGTAVTPVNLNRNSANTADVTAYDNNPTVGGTFTEIDRWYVDAEAGERECLTNGELIIQPRGTFSVRVTSDHTSGVAMAQVIFGMR